MSDPTTLRIRVAAAPGRAERPPILVARHLPGQSDGPSWEVDGVPVDARLEGRGENRAALHGLSGSTPLLFLPGPEGPETRRTGERGNATPQTIEVIVHGWRLVVTVEPAARAALRDLARRVGGGRAAVPPAEVRAIIPGRVASIAVSLGAAVEPAQPLLIVEAMKMQNELRAPRGGTVRQISVVAGQTVEAGALLVVIE